MEAKQALILVLCSMILAGEVACFPTEVRAKSSFSQDDAAALAKYEDWEWKTILKKIPKFLFPVLRKILKGIANSEDPMDILLSILGEEPKKKKNRKNKKNKKKNKKENNENENNENKEEEPEPAENPESEKPAKESQEDMNQSDKHEINGPQDW